MAGKKKKRAVTFTSSVPELRGYEGGIELKPGELATSCFTAVQTPSKMDPLTAAQIRKAQAAVQEADRILSIREVCAAADMVPGRTYGYPKTPGCHYELPKTTTREALERRLEARVGVLHSREVYLLNEVRRIGTHAVVAWRVSAGDKGAERREYVILEPELELTVFPDRPTSDRGVAI